MFSKKMSSTYNNINEHKLMFISFSMNLKLKNKKIDRKLHFSPNKWQF